MKRVSASPGKPGIRSDWIIQRHSSRGEKGEGLAEDGTNASNGMVVAFGLIG
jgi:hypothetical protein